MSSSEEDTCVRVDSSTKKRRKFGTVREASKKLRNTTYETGPDCKCKRYQCFKNITLEERSVLIRDFNALADRNAQNSFLPGLITVGPVQRRRPRKSEAGARLNDYSYMYKVRVMRNEKVTEIPICYTGFISVFGVTDRRLSTIKSPLCSTGQPPIDKRGKHTDRGKRKLPQETYNAMNTLFISLKGRKAHYSLKDSNKVYLSEDLNIKKLFGMFLEMFPKVVMSYENFRETFSTKFNISFGYPRSDTCSTCD